jgi:Predicted integral membrane protein (DUF2269)
MARAPGTSEHWHCRVHPSRGASVDFTIFKFLHIAFMFTAVAGTVFPEVYLHLVANTREPRTTATVAHIAERIGKVIPVFFVGGAIFGLITAWRGELDFTAPWLLATYVLFITAMAVGILVSDPWVARVRTAALASGEAPSSAFAAVVDESRAKIASGWLMLSIVVIIALMVFKPGN